MKTLLSSPASRQKLFNLLECLALLTIILLVNATLAEAAATGGGFEYEKGLKKYVNSVTGPVAYGAGSVGIVGTMIYLWQRHSDLGAIGWGMASVVVLICIGCMAVKFLSSLGVGALI